MQTNYNQTLNWILYKQYANKIWLYFVGKFDDDFARKLEWLTLC